MNSLREPLPPQSLYRRCDPQQFPFETTAELDDLTDIIEVTTFAVGHLIDELRAKYRDLPAVVEHLDVIRRDVISNTRT